MGKLETDFAFAGCALLCALVGAVFDLRTRRIPNFFTLPAIVFGLVLHLYVGGLRQLGSATLAGLICGGIFLLFHLAGGMGGGDVKLMTAAGCNAGLSLLGPLLLWTSITGGLMAVAVALYHGRMKQTLRNLYAIFLHHRVRGLVQHPELNVGNEQTLRLPYALAIAAGCALSLGALFSGVRR